MKIVYQTSAEICDNCDPMEHIERIGRICYKSEDKITEGSAAKFISMLYDNNHMAMLEHYRFIYRVSKSIYDAIVRAKSHYDIYIETTNITQRLISTSARGLIDAIDIIEDDYGAIAACCAIIKQIVADYGCMELFGSKYTALDQPTALVRVDQYKLTGVELTNHGWHSVLFRTDRGVTHELVRHRPASFAQESTRYCNYSNDKYDNEITVIALPSDCDRSYSIWKETCEKCEESYIDMINNGVSAQIARSVLPTCVKANIVVTATNKEWQHIINLRWHGKTGKPHPQMKQLMGILRNSCDWAAAM